MAKLDVLDKFSILLLLVPWVAFIGLFAVQYSKLRVTTFRIQVLSTRLALFLPFYATILFLCVIIPESYLGLQIVIAIVEAFSFYCCFALIVANQGGPDATVAQIQEQGSQPVCCTPCCPTTPKDYYNRMQWALFHFSTTRIFVVILVAIFGYEGMKIGLFITSLISFCFVVNAFLTLVLFYEMLYTASGNLRATCKILLMKTSVGLIVLQGLAEEFLFATGHLSKLNFNDDIPPSENSSRAYCFLVLIEFAIYSVLLFYAFSLDMTANAKTVTVRRSQADGYQTSTSSTASASLLGEGSSASVLQFFFAVFSFCDIYGTLTPGDSSDATKVVNNL